MTPDVVVSLHHIDVSLHALVVVLLVWLAIWWMHQ